MHAELVDRRRGRHIERTDLTFGEYARSWLTDRAGARVRLGRMRRGPTRSTSATAQPPAARAGWHPAPAPRRRHAHPPLRAVARPAVPETIANVHSLAIGDPPGCGAGRALARNPADRAVKPCATELSSRSGLRGDRPVPRARAPARSRLAHLVRAHRDHGIRRVEAVGATSAAFDLAAVTPEMRQTITKAGSQIVVTEPKSSRSRRPVPLAAPVVALLEAHGSVSTCNDAGAASHGRSATSSSQTGPVAASTPTTSPRSSPCMPASAACRTLGDLTGSAIVGVGHDANGSGLATIGALLGRAPPR